MSLFSELSPRRAPEPGRPFVNREPELANVKEKVDVGLRGEPMPSVITCFWGQFGMGKSWLSIELERRYQGGPQVTASHPTLAARLDMNPQISAALWRDKRLDVGQVIQELWRQLAQQRNVEIPDFAQGTSEDWAHSFAREITGWVAHFTPVIILDTVDAVIRDDEAAFFWLEENLIEPLALTNRVLFVLTSRGELRRWQRFQVRRRIESRSLNAFNGEMAGDQVKANPTIVRVIYQHSFGHPLATEYLATTLQDRGVNLSEAKSEQAHEVLDTDTVKMVLQKVTDEILESIEDDLLAQLARQASILRWVNVEPLSHLAQNLGFVERGRRDNFYLELIGKLQAHHILYWDVESASYKSDPALRRLLAHYLELTDIHKFKQAHLAAYRYHLQHLDDFPQFLARYVPEAAYHYSSVTRVNHLPNDLPSFWTWWQHFISQPIARSSTAWQELAAALENDTELCEVLSDGQYAELVIEAQQRAAIVETAA